MQAITGAPEGMTRAEAARLAGLLPAKIGFHAVQQDRILKDGKLNACWLICDKSLQTAPNTNNETDIRSSKVKRTRAFTPVHDPPWPHAALPPPPLALG